MRQFFAAILFLISFAATAQNNTIPGTPGYPLDYFRNPLDIPIFLAGNFGECRPGHFHSGVDIKTLGKENQPVHAAADGYISRIKMEKGGFGHALYITHPNGYTTLYAHLNDFNTALQAYLKQEQYAKKHWDVDVQLTPDQFPVKKGDHIAWSGNTGASTAPHLHFEIRDTKTEHPLNPELFGLPIVDKIAPLPAEMVIYGKDKYLMGYNATEKTVLALRKENDIYKPVPKKEQHNDDQCRVIQDTVILSEDSKIGIGINVDDHMDGSDNTIAFYTAQLYMDDSLQTEIVLDNIGYDETRYINAYADYSIQKEKGKWIQCLYKLPGNHLDRIYTHLNANDGRLLLNDKGPHKVKIVITDDKQNKSEIGFYVRSEFRTIVNAPRFVTQRLSFLPGRPNGYSGKDYRFALESNALYDMVVFIPGTTPFDSGYSDKHEVLNPYIPAHSSFVLDIKPTKPVTQAIATKLAMMYSDGKEIDGRAAAVTDSGWYRARVRSFGTYWLAVDTIPPVIMAMQKNKAVLTSAKQIALTVTDNMTSVKKFSATLDGKWICFEQHGSTFFYKFDEHCPKGKHQLVFTAEDENGNAASYHLAFTR